MYVSKEDSAKVSGFCLLFRKSFLSSFTDLLELHLDLPELCLGFLELRLYWKCDQQWKWFLQMGVIFKDVYRTFLWCHLATHGLVPKSRKTGQKYIVWGKSIVASNHREVELFNGKEGKGLRGEICLLSHNGSYANAKQKVGGKVYKLTSRFTEQLANLHLVQRSLVHICNCL